MNLLRRNSTKNRGCTGKQAHPTRAAAEEHMTHLIRGGTFMPAMNVYRCRHCSKPNQPAVWHVGHRPGFGASR